MDSFREFFLFSLNAGLFFMIFLCTVVLLIFFLYAMGGWLFGIEGVNSLNAGVDEVDELHFEFEACILFELSVDMVYFLMQVFYFFGEVYWSIILIHNYDII